MRWRENRLPMENLVKKVKRRIDWKTGHDFVNEKASLGTDHRNAENSKREKGNAISAGPLTREGGVRHPSSSLTLKEHRRKRL